MPFAVAVGTVYPAAYMRGNRETFNPGEMNFPRCAPHAAGCDHVRLAGVSPATETGHALQCWYMCSSICLSRKSPFIERKK